MKIPDSVIVILIGTALIYVGFINPETRYTASQLIKIQGTLSENPEFQYPTRGSGYGTIKLKEFRNRDFSFNISSFALRALKRNDFFNEVKQNDQIKITITKEEYENRIKDLEYPRSWQFINTYVSVISIETNDKIYSTYEDTNNSHEQDEKLGIIFGLAGATIIIGYFLWKYRKRR
jgi:hypothetical protein